ncbi:MAG: amidase [Gammaproteobacteria bacterium]|nr:amidase [Gammaproteobacteria bacterium]MCY4164650.1 amidase [Gammaproteobacteria bacterium]MCY4340336.1 amidase [Gammaproteobacteria bacterium]
MLLGNTPQISRQPEWLAPRLATGEVSSEQAVERCIERFEQREKAVRAFAAFDAERALGEARARDRERASQGPRSVLHGLPFAVKDVIDTVDLPTQRNSPRYEGRRPEQDAACVRMLRQAGCVLLGKAATVEFAGIGRDSPTTNPHDPQRTPGGSSAGSAAAVAAGMAPMALGTQTGGSVIRPASFCGVAGFKPTYGRVPVQGLWLHAPSLDTVGWIAENVELLARAAEALKLGEWQAPKASSRLRIGLYRTPYWHDAEPASRSAVERAADRLAAAGHSVENVDEIPGAERLNEWQDVIMHGEARISLLADYGAGKQGLHADIIEEVEVNREITPRAMAAAYDGIGGLRPVFDQRLASYDAWLTASVPSEAALREEGDGEATFNRLFTALQLPCVTVPGLKGPAGLPIGVQLVAARFADMRVLAAARSLEKLLAES